MATKRDHVDKRLFPSREKLRQEILRTLRNTPDKAQAASVLSVKIRGMADLCQQALSDKYFIAAELIAGHVLDDPDKAPEKLRTLFEKIISLGDPKIAADAMIREFQSFAKQIIAAIAKDPKDDEGEDWKRGQKDAPDADGE